MEEKTLFDTFIHECESDTTSNEDRSETLETIYNDSTPKQKEAIDKVMVALCGWRIPTLQDMYNKRRVF